jgi:hypothetical protein
MQAPDIDPLVSQPTEELAPPSAGKVLRSLVPSIVINGVFPFLLYQVLTSRGIAAVPALVAGSVFPVGYTSWSWVRTRRIDFIAGLSLFFIVVSAAASLMQIAMTSQLPGKAPTYVRGHVSSIIPM